MNDVESLDEAKVAALRNRLREDTADIRADLERWAERIHPSRAASLTSALLEMGIDRQIDLLGITDARDLVKRIFDRQAHKYRRSLQ